MKKENNLAVQRPDIAKEWHPIKNEDLKASDVTPGSAKKVWWQCPVNPEHEYPLQINYRSRRKGCPHCSKEKRAKSA